MANTFSWIHAELKGMEEILTMALADECSYNAVMPGNYEAADRCRLIGKLEALKAAVNDAQISARVSYKRYEEQSNTEG